MVHREIEHGRRPEADAGDGDSGGGKPFDQRRFKAGGTQPAVIADCRAAPAAPRQDGAERAAECQRICLVQRRADNAARIVFAQEARMEPVPAHVVRPFPMPR